MAEQPGARGAWNLVGAIVSSVAATVLVVAAVVMVVLWSAQGMMPWSGETAGFMFWWVAPVLGLIGASLFAVGSSYAKQWRRRRMP